ncbi:hypothetical protein Fuma_02952 [Fuerstiella marisgermanici]|uniref:SF3 helicase domain-containing protein n=2 Tax=Fuerstiella marisgermanici TaxID=1891926 RepID=A0A1P8WH21_9PLAN|nr:hypothetical protein Fuma_02952 [Fuerstiella marisgermanici]
MYLSNTEPILVDESTRNHRTEIVSRLYEMNFNLIPMNGKNPCVEWNEFQTHRVTPQDLRKWLTGKFPTKDGRRIWKARNHNFALLTGAIPWSDDNPGIIVVDSDDEEAEELVRNHCPPTPMMQVTGSGNKQFVYRRPPIEAQPFIGSPTKLRLDGKQYNLDIRGDGGLIMIPGSIHPKTGSMYEEVTSWTMELLMECPVYDPAWLPYERAKTKKTSAFITADIISDEHEDLIAQVQTEVEERESQARCYLDSVPGTQEGTGADNKCSALTMKLLYGFALPVNVVQEMLSEWGRKPDQFDASCAWYPWTDDEIARKIDWCLGQSYEGRIADRLSPFRDVGPMEAKVDDVVKPVDDNHTIDPKNHLETAELFRRECFAHNHKPTLIHHQATWHGWTGKLYEVISDDDIKARLWKWLATCKTWSKDKRTTFKPTRNVVGGVMDGLKAVTNQSSQLEAPCWLSNGPEEIIAFDNGLLNVREFLSGKDNLLSHTPNWFSPNCLPHRFDHHANCPTWLDFLNQVFDEDEERINTLQQWFGYNLVSDNRQHKIAMLIGPPRSGKGTTMAMMSAMLGRHNIANTSLASLGGRFGLEPLVGKMSALIDEGHLGRYSDNSLILERLKAISGGSEQTVDRKGVKAISSVAMKVRFTMAVNELPRLSDSSAALRSRLLIIPFNNTYEGKEDFGLVDSLLKEVSGITNWSLKGLKQLRANGRFKNPIAGEKIMRDFVYLSSPVQSFLDECCLVGSDKSVRFDDIQTAWKAWCEQNGHVSGSNNDFGRKLRAAIPRIDDERRRNGAGRDRWYKGLGLNPETILQQNCRSMIS